MHHSKDELTKLENYLITLNTQYNLKEQQRYKDTLTELEGNSAYIDMLIKVKEAPESDAKDFWMDRLSKIDNVLDELKRVKYDMLTLEIAYRELYLEYDRLVNVINKLRDEF